MILRRSPLPLFAMVLTVGLLVVPAGAVHLFPLVPGDPFGDCAVALEPDPGGSVASVGVKEFSFVDDATEHGRSQVTVGESVTWRWDNQFCHSVTFQRPEVDGTYGGPPGGFDGAEPELVKPEGVSNTFTLTFDTPGTFDYVCVHHGSMGMTGTVVVHEVERV